MLLIRAINQAGGPVATRRGEALGARIRAARDAKGWKQKELAAAVRVEPVTVSRWENGHNQPDLDKLDDLAEALEQPLSYFLGDDVPAVTMGELLEAQARNDRELQSQRAMIESLLVELRRLRRLLPPADSGNSA